MFSCYVTVLYTTPDYAVSCPPFPLSMNKEALYKVRGDLYAGAMKLHEDTLSITAELELLVDEKDGEEVWNLTEGDSVEVGPFRVSSNVECSFLWVAQQRLWRIPLLQFI